MEKKCGVDKSLYSKYEFEDHIWYQNKPESEDLLHLAQRCVKIGPNYFMKKAKSHHWVILTSLVDAEKEAVNTWLGATLPSGNIVDEDLISTFFSGFAWVAGPTIKSKAVKSKVGSCPNISERMSLPLGPSFINYNNQQYLNTWYNDMTEGNVDNIKLGKSVLLLCYASLCNGVVDKENLIKEADRIYNMVVSDDYDNVEFRFFINWLAAIYQFPGINLQTNIWLIGAVQGLGKGTIVSIMKQILGAEFVGALNQIEIEAGWNDHLVGLQLVEINEFDTNGKWSGKAWDKWIKGHTNEVTLNIRERNRRSYSVLNLGNYIGISNITDQSFIDSNDRRNMLIRTTSDESWVQYASAFQRKYFKPNPKGVASGFAYILEQVKVDMKLISISHKTELRAIIAANNQTIVEEWNEGDPSIIKGKWVSSGDMFDRFVSWYRTAYPGSNNIPSITKWGIEMGKATHLGIQKNRTASGNLYYFGTAAIKEEYKLEDSVAVLNGITGDTDTLDVYDLDMKESVIDPSKMSPVEKMRAALRQQKAEFGDNFANQEM